jgi:hypothetical protein
MALKISDETLKKTTKCMFGFQCLDDKSRDICKIGIYIQGDGCFLSKVKSHTCPYKQLAGYSSYTCTCPTRHELYTRYKI